MPYLKPAERRKVCACPCRRSFYDESPRAVRRYYDSRECRHRFEKARAAQRLK